MEPREISRTYFGRTIKWSHQQFTPYDWLFWELCLAGGVLAGLIVSRG